MAKTQKKIPERGPARSGVADAKASRLLLLLFLLVVLPAATFWRIRANQFISYDDPEYVTANVTVRQGLTWEGVVWAFTTRQAANWHPVTWLSHMADVSLFGMNPAGHHTTNLLLHVANTLLLFLLFRSLTREEVKSAWVAALFAVHPAHVESVAWAAERKDLLSGLFWLATTWAYVAWVRKRGSGRYAAVLALFAAGLMSKPMLVSLPLVLLLLDVWPLTRLPGAGKGFAGLVFEKAPLFLLAAASSVVTFLVQRAGGAVRTFETFPFWTRVGNALVAYADYLRILVWPARLAVFYPHPGRSLSVWSILLSALLLAALSAAAILLRRRFPYLFVGWFWFVITLLPVIGLVQVGFQALADRYTYVPFIGLFVTLAWGLPAVVSRWPAARRALPAAAVVAVLALALKASAQAGLWKDSETLYLHAIAVTKANTVARNNLADYYNDVGRPAAAVPHLTEAMRIDSTKSELHTNLGRALFLLGRFEEAEQEFSQAQRLHPGDAVVLNNLARTRFVQGDVHEAIRLYQATNALQPGSPDIRMRLAIALLMEGKTAAARGELQRAADMAPSQPLYRRLAEGVPALDRTGQDPSGDELRRVLSSAHQEVAVGLQRRGKKTEALDHFRQAVALFPGSAGAHLDLGALLTGEDRLAEAEAEFRAAVRLEPGSALAHTDLGYVFYLQGRREEAIEQHREALRLQPGFPLAQNNLEEALRGRAEERR